MTHTNPKRQRGTPARLCRDCGLKPFAIVFGMVLLISGGQHVSAQPLLREGDVESDADVEPDADALRQRDLARQKAQLEEERRLKLQEEFMRIRGEQMQAEQAEIKRRDTMMRYALIIAIAVIATTLLIAYARSRVANGAGQGGP